MDFTKYGRLKYNKLFVKNGNGDYDYIGPTYAFGADKEARRKLKILYALLAVIMIGAFILSGFVTPPAAQKWYVLGPYAFMFLPLVFLIKDIALFVMSKSEMKQWNYDSSVAQLKITAYITLGLSAFSLIGCLVNLIFTADRLQGGVNMLIGSILTVLCSGAISFIHTTRVPVIKTEGNG